VSFQEGDEATGYSFILAMKNSSAAAFLRNDIFNYLGVSR